MGVEASSVQRKRKILEAEGCMFDGAGSVRCECMHTFSSFEKVVQTTGEEQLEFDAPMKVASTGKTKRLRGRALAPKPKP